jgi:hypothetical protein
MKKINDLGMCSDGESMEEIGGVGCGCVRPLPETSEWTTEWRRIPRTIDNCNRHSLRPSEA